jgi:hypothetical protein
MTQEQTNQNVRTRRSFLKSTLGVGGGIAAAGFVRSIGGSHANTASAFYAEDGVATIINLATTMETLAVTFYYAAITGATFRMSEEDAQHLKLVMDAEMHHLQILQALGGASLAQRFYLPKRALSDAGTFVSTGLRAETIFAGAYLAATHQFASFGQPKLAATAAQHGASEAQHHTLLSRLAGLAPSDLSLPAPIFFRVSEAVPALAPFLEGGDGFSKRVHCPASDDYRSSLAGTVTMAKRGSSFIQAYGMDARTLG